MSTDRDGNGTVAISDVDNLGAVLDRVMERIDDLEESHQELADQLNRLKNEKGSREAKLDRVIAHAARVQRDGEDVNLDYSEVMAAAGVSPPTAYSYIDTLAEERELAEKKTSVSGKTRLVLDGSRLSTLKHDQE